METPHFISCLGVRGCLSPDTRVLLSDSVYVVAGALRVGSLLKAAHSPWGITPVRLIRMLTGEFFVRINDVIEVTEYHPFLTARGAWIPASRLEYGDALVGPLGPQRINTIERIHREESSVIDIVTDYPFWAEGFLTLSKSVFRQNPAVNGELLVNLPSIASDLQVALNR